MSKSELSAASAEETAQIMALLEKHRGEWDEDGGKSKDEETLFQTLERIIDERDRAQHGRNYFLTAMMDHARGVR